MRSFYLLSLFILSAIYVGAQTQPSQLYKLVTSKNASAVPVNLFQVSNEQSSLSVQKLLASKTNLSIDKAAVANLYKIKNASISLSIPSATGKGYTLELVKEDLNSIDEDLIETSTGKTNLEIGLHYRGYINGNPTSIASFSVFANGEVMGLFSNENGNFNIGKINGSKDAYVLYNSKDMQANLGVECGTDKLPVISGNKPVTNNEKPSDVPAQLCKKVRLYWEADYKLYANNFSQDLTSTTNYLLGLFNQVSVMYQNEGVVIELAKLFVWTTQDPYTTTTSSNGLATLKSRWNGLGNNFAGDLLMLIDGAPTNNGGLAYLLDNDYCNRPYAYGYADIYATYNAVPTYSWDVEVMTHEMGHLMGSHHTMWCGWKTGANGTCGAIDNCYPVETIDGVCPTCNALTNITDTTPPPPGFKGTVMSYCYLKSGIGVNLANGFGPLPQAAIRSSINNTTCTVLDNKWTGAVSTAWENTANWSCGSLPNANTDVTISNGLTNYPIVNSAAVCRRIKQQPGSTVRVNTGFTVNVVGLPGN